MPSCNLKQCVLTIVLGIFFTKITFIGYIEMIWLASHWFLYVYQQSWHHRWFTLGAWVDLHVIRGRRLLIKHMVYVILWTFISYHINSVNGHQYNCLFSAWLKIALRPVRDGLKPIGPIAPFGPLLELSTLGSSSTHINLLQVLQRTILSPAASKVVLSSSEQGVRCWTCN